MQDENLPPMYPWQLENFRRKFDELVLFGRFSEEAARQMALTHALSAEPIELSPDAWAGWPEVSQWPATPRQSTSARVRS